jgi:Zn-finger nucleic acid-binding protein
MDKPTFQVADEHIDRIFEIVDEALESPKLENLRSALAVLSKALGERYSVILDCNIAIFDNHEERTLTMLQTGLSTSNGGEPSRIWGDSSPQKYVVDGEIQVVPHDHCPKCWGTWDFKFEHRTCPECGATLGEDIRVLLDTDVCPSCEEGSVSMASPHCNKCGFEADQKTIAWG